MKRSATSPTKPPPFPCERKLAPFNTAPARSRLLQALALVAGAALGGCVPVASGETPVLSVSAGYTADAPAWTEVLRDPYYFRSGAVLYGRDLAYRADRLRRHLKGDGYSKPDASLVARMQRTVDFLESPLRARPEVVKFQLQERDGGLHWEPLEWDPVIKARKTVRADLAIIGAELESLVAACTAADRGMSVAVVYSGPLGGLCSDSGGNLRYVDGIRSIPRPTAQRNLYVGALGMAPDNVTSLPANVSSLLARYLQRRYAARIRLLKTGNLNTLHVDVGDKRISEITTGEGIEVVARAYLDTDPEGRLAEKCGLKYDVNAPNLASGMVFDVAGLTGSDWQRMQNARSISVNAILSQAGISRKEVPTGSGADVCIRRLEKTQTRDRTHIYGNSSFGFQSLAEGFDLYQQARGLRLKDRELLRLNAMRCTSGFNISESRGVATFNGVSYHFPTALLQNDHDLLREPRFRAFRRWEGPGLQAYFRFITGNPRVTIRLPRQFYVRRASALFRTLEPYGREDFTGAPRSRFWMRYPMDLRNNIPRDPYEERLVAEIWDNPLSQGRMTWDCRASSTVSEIDNLYLVNKSSVPVRYFGGLRIIQNLINTGTVLVSDLSDRRLRVAESRSKKAPSRAVRKAPRLQASRT